MDLSKEWISSILYLISDNPERFYKKYLPDTQLDPVGVNLRLQPCPMCGHYDCCTVTPGEVVVNCFSPGCFSGTHLKFIFQVLGYTEELVQDISNFYGVDASISTENTTKRLFEIRNIATKFYHVNLLNNDKAITYQIQNRKHSMETLKRFLVGFSGDFDKLREGLISSGYTFDEINDAKIWIPEGLFVYPYINSHNHLVYRFNTKNPFGVTYRDKEIKGFSTGEKYLFSTPNLKSDYIILVEGENDLMSVYEVGGQCAIAVGGKISKEQLGMFNSLLPKFKTIYCMFDSDEPGVEYEVFINNNFPHLNIYHVNYGNFKDPDEAIKSGSITDITTYLQSATLLESVGYSVTHKRNIWNIQNRRQQLEFEILDKNRTGSLIGNIKLFEGDTLKDIEYDKTLAKSKFKPLSFHLIEAMEEFFNDNLEEKSFGDLLKIYPHTKWKAQVLKLLAKYIFGTADEDKEELVVAIKRELNDEIADIVLKEVNELQNEEIYDYASIPKMKLGQFFSVKNNEAFMYFTYVKKDNDTIRKLPYLVTSDRKLIRLDLYKRKDEQCLLLIRNKYELPIEVPQAIMDLQRVSLSQFPVEEYIEEKMDEHDLDPKVLIRRLENFIRKYFYAEDESVYKVLALWIYGTYCYELFGQYPYLFLNGPKGSGKTVLDVCIDLLAFNPKMTVSITNAALFRSVSIEGGTLILDEMENLNNRKQTADSDLAAVLKGGYMRSGCAMRCDKDNGNIPQMFNVFGPKVISNIFGLEDIIGDRCIQVNTKAVGKTDLRKLEDPKQLYIDGLSWVRELTSKCALSILEHFMYIYKVYKENVFYTENARLSQILRPLQTLAFIAGRDYERAFLDFYINNLKVTKEETEYETPEGALKDILLDVAHEIVGAREPNYVMSHTHKYKNPIKVDLTEGWFELDVVHIKTFMEEVLSGVVDLKNINTWVRRVSAVNMYSRRRRTTVSLEDENLIKEFNGNTRLKVTIYRFYLSDFFNEEELTLLKERYPKIEEELKLEDL